MINLGKIIKYEGDSKMGMYTGLRCKLIVKEEFREFINQINNSSAEWGNSYDNTLKEFASYSRSCMIPRGSLSYMPDQWNESKEFNDNMDTKNGYWNFKCSLKNYEGEIDYFINNIIPVIAESASHIEVFYEEWASSSFYELVEGKIYRNENKDITYGYDESPDWNNRWYDLKKEQESE